MAKVSSLRTFVIPAQAGIRLDSRFRGNDKNRGNDKGFTLIELLISIVLIVIISSAVFFAVQGSLDSWSWCRDQLSLQKVLAETMDTVISGSVQSFGLKDSLEIVSAGRT